MARSRTRSLHSLIFRSARSPSPPPPPSHTASQLHSGVGSTQGRTSTYGDAHGRPPSPTFSEVSTATGLAGGRGPEKVITRKNLRDSIAAYDELMTMTAKYRAALQAMAVATDGFAHAMEKCASLKGPTYEASTRLQGAAGMHYLVGNNWSFLAETLDRNFERPLRGSLEEYRRVVEERSSAYERELRARSQVIRETEMGNMNKKQRNLQSFREALTVLQRQVDELDDLKIAHYQEIVDHEVEVWEGVQNKVCLAVRSTMEVFDKITTKSSDPILEQMLQSVPDPFDAYRPPPTEFEQSGMGEQIFSILPPLSIISNVPSALPSPSVGGGSELSAASSLNTSNSMMGGMKERHNSWPGPGAFDNGATEWAEVSSRSPSPPTPPRSASPPGTRKSHHLRKSESKMRNVLTVIDESQSHTSTGLTRPPPMTNSSTGSSEGSGGTIRAPPSSESRPSSDSRPSLGSSDSRQGSGQWFGTTKRNSEPGSAGTSGSTSNSASSSWIAGLNGLNDPPWNTSFGTEAEAGGYGYGESPYGGEQGSHGGEKGPYGDENGTLRAEDSTPSRTRRGENGGGREDKTPRNSALFQDESGFGGEGIGVGDGAEVETIRGEGTPRVAVAG